jgi:hypothetical protein
MSSAGFEPTIPAIEWPQTHVLDRTATGISTRIIEQTLSKRSYIYVQTPSVLDTNFFLISDFLDRTELWHAEGTGGSLFYKCTYCKTNDRLV